MQVAMAMKAFVPAFGPLGGPGGAGGFLGPGGLFPPGPDGDGGETLGTGREAGSGETLRPA